LKGKGPTGDHEEENEEWESLLWGNGRRQEKRVKETVCQMATGFSIKCFDEGRGGKRGVGTLKEG